MTSSSANKKRPLSLLTLSLILLAPILLVYFVAFSSGFFNLDDPTILIENPVVIAFDLTKIFTDLRVDYLPMVYFSYAIEHSLIGLNPLYYHIDNVLLHWLNSILVYYFVFQITKKNSFISIFTALAFALHPTHVESVTWITERKDVLFTFFLLISCILYLRESPYSIITYILSLMSKMMPITFPGVLILIDWFNEKPINKKSLTRKWPFFLAALVFLAINSYVHRTTVQKISTDSLISGFTSIPFYLSKSLIPVGLSIFYEKGAVPFNIVDAIALLISIFIIVWVWNRGDKRLAQFGALFALIAIFPALGFVPFDNLANRADRYLYLSSVGIFMVYGAFLDSIFSKMKIPVVVAAGVYISVFGILTYNRNTIWQSSEMLWEDVVRKYPQSSYGYNNIGKLYFSPTNIPFAKTEFEKALALNPKLVEAHLNLGIALATEGKTEEAFVAFEKAKQLDPKDPNVYNSIGSVQLKLAQNDDAQRNYEKAVELGPTNIEAHYGLGMAFSKKGIYSRGKLQFSRVLKLDPNHADAKKNLEIISLLKDR